MEGEGELGESLTFRTIKQQKSSESCKTQKVGSTVIFAQKGLGMNYQCSKLNKYRVLYNQPWIGWLKVSVRYRQVDTNSVKRIPYHCSSYLALLRKQPAALLCYQVLSWLHSSRSHVSPCHVGGCHVGGWRGGSSRSIW